MSETTDLRSINVLLGDFTVKLMQRDDVTDIWVNANAWPLYGILPVVTRNFAPVKILLSDWISQDTTPVFRA